MNCKNFLKQKAINTNHNMDRWKEFPHVSNHQWENHALFALQVKFCIIIKEENSTFKLKLVKGLIIQLILAHFCTFWQNNNNKKRIRHTLHCLFIKKNHSYNQIHVAWKYEIVKTLQQKFDCFKMIKKQTNHDSPMNTLMTQPNIMSPVLIKMCLKLLGSMWATGKEVGDNHCVLYFSISVTVLLQLCYLIGLALDSNSKLNCILFIFSMY